MSTSDRNGVQSSPWFTRDHVNAGSQEPGDAILRKRAEALARPSVPLRPLRDEIAILAFAIAGERYAVETRYVVEVVGLDHYVPVPDTPDFLAGLMPYRGAILPAIDLGALLGSSVRLRDVRYAIVHGIERAEFGILASQIEEVASLEAAELLAAGDAPSRYLRGATRDGLIVLDGRALLDSRALRVHAVDPSNASPSEEGTECSAK